MTSKFLFSNFVINYKENQFINLNYKKNKIQKKKYPRFKINSLPTFHFNEKNIEQLPISINFETVYKDDYLEIIRKYIKWEKLFCKSAYNYILKQSMLLKGNSPISKNKYLINKEWNFEYLLKDFQLLYNYNELNEKEYCKIISNIWYKTEKIIFSKSLIRKLIKDPHDNYKEFMNSQFSYDDDISKLNVETLSKTLNDMINPIKSKFIGILASSYDNIFGECYMNYKGIQMELDTKSKTCFVNMKQDITKFVIY